MHLLALRRKGHDDVAALLLRLGLDGAVFLDIVGQTLQQFHATNRAGDLTTAQHDGDLDLVASVKEAGHMALLHVEIVVVNLQAETNLLDFRGALVAASFTSLDLLVVLELAVINELGDRRLRVRGHLDEIEVCLLGQVQRDGSRDDAHLLALRADQAYLRDANLVVNTWFVADDDSNPLLQFRGEGLCWSPVQCFGFMASKARANMRSASADAYQFFASFLITRCISQSLGCLP